MKIIAIDTETHLIKDNNIPAPVCLTAVVYDEETGSTTPFLSSISSQLCEWLISVFESQDHTIVMHNSAYDLCVLVKCFPILFPSVFSAIAQGRVHDTMIIEQLHKIAHGGDGKGVYKNGLSKLSLGGLVYKYFDLDLSDQKKQEDSVRYRYSALRNTPFENWEDDAKSYAVLDPMFTLLVYKTQIDQIPPREISEHDKQVGAAFALKLTSSQGICVDQSKVDQVELSLSKLIDELSQPLLVHNLLVSDKTGVKENKKQIVDAVETAYVTQKKEIKKTASGATSLDKESLEDSNDPNLAQLLEYREVSKLLSTYVDSIKMVSSSLLDGRLRCEYEVLQATGRTSSKNPNLQNLPRREGIRDCFVPSKGFIFIACDYDAAELRTLAQCHYSMTGNKSLLLEMYQSDPSFDPHTWFACKMMGITYEEGIQRKKNGDKEIKANRQRAKASNFGFPGGMGAVSFMAYAKGYGVNLSLDEAETLRNEWFTAWNMWDWLTVANNASSSEDREVIIPISNRIRGKVGFTQACNTPFQGLASDGAKLALFNVAKECFSDKESALYGSRPVVFIHDEIIIETPVYNAQSAALRLQEVMRESMQAYCPNVPIEASPTLMTYWSKNAESKFVNGSYTIWDGN